MTNTELFVEDICFVPLGTCPFQWEAVMRYSTACKSQPFFRFGRPSGRPEGPITQPTSG
jgi:hypothetical protein